MTESAFPPLSFRPLLEEISSLLKERKETVSVAETVYTPCLLSDQKILSKRLTHMPSNGIPGRRRNHLSVPPLCPRCIRLLQRWINSTYILIHVSIPDH